MAFESPRRVPGTLALLADIDPAREVAVCRELTKAHEEIVRGTAAELAARYEGPPKGEVVLVIGPTGGVRRTGRGSRRPRRLRGSWTPAPAAPCRLGGGGADRGGANALYAALTSGD